jgi:hypothetical protein
MIQTNRRSFLKGLGILGAAPAIVHAENIMKIWTPPKEIIRPAGFYKLSFWMRENGKDWQQFHHVHWVAQDAPITIAFPRTFTSPPEINWSNMKAERL